MISAKIIADSMTHQGERLTTMVMVYPRMVHAEHLRHRCFSFSAASSRAIPAKRFVNDVLESPALPVHWGTTQPGMQAGAELTGVDLACAQDTWLKARDSAIAHHARMMELKVAKQICNRILEPWFNITVLVSGTEWENFFALRCHKDAQPEIQAVADAALYQYAHSKPKCVELGGWHIPFADQLMDPAWDEETKLKVGAARCARVSYENFEGEVNLAKDLALFDSLCQSGHMSPFEHVAQAMPRGYRSGNFTGWRQLRKGFVNECRKVDMWALLKSRIEAGSRFACAETQAL